MLVVQEINTKAALVQMERRCQRMFQGRQMS